MNAPTQAIEPLDSLLQKLRAELPQLRERYGVERLAVFGSYARNEQRPDSDLDILVSFRVKPGLIQFITLEQHLTDLLGVTVDLIMESAVRPDIVARIQAEKKVV